MPPDLSIRGHKNQFHNLCIIYDACSVKRGLYASAKSTDPVSLESVLADKGENFLQAVQLAAC